MHYVLDLPPELADQSVPTLLLQPLVENSIKHGLEPKVEGGTITVRATRDGQKLTLQVSDTGVGFDSEAALSNGFGLAQVRERLTAAYADQGRVEQTSTRGQGTTILLHLPMTVANA
jgi:sensor histidine kinase YesM